MILKGMSQVQSDNKIIRIFKNWSVGNILTVIIMFGGSYVYVNNKYDNIMTALAQNAKDNAVVKAQYSEIKEQLGGIKNHDLLIDDKIDKHEKLITQAATILHIPIQ